MNVLLDFIDEFNLAPNNKVYCLKVNSFQQINRNILDQFLAAEEFYEHSHWIQGRWENTYCPITLLPTVKKLFEQVIQWTSQKFKHSLIIPHSVPGMENNGFWFNQMPPESKTGLHDHKSASFLSGVYYLKVPENSGNIIFEEGENIREIQSIEGNLLLFSPSLMHRVTENRSASERVSLAFNLYTLPL